MAASATTFDVYLEAGQKRTFAGAIDWPGWCCSGRDEASALQALVETAPRYARAIGAARLKFRSPDAVEALAVVERLPGNATTDFGAPDAAPASDAQPFDEAEHKRSQAVLKACWAAFDRAIAAATGKELQKGPRGGGRDLDGIIRHVRDADAGYLARLAQKFERDAATAPAALDRTRQAMLAALAAGARGEIPERGPRGGALWIPRRYVRRVAWHTLDHAWEIEDRIVD